MTSRLASILCTVLLGTLLVASLSAAESKHSTPIEIRAEIFQIKAETAHKLGITPQPYAKHQGAGAIAKDTPDTKDKLVASLRQSKEATLLGTPIISTVDGQLATISMRSLNPDKSVKDGTSLVVRPKILRDGAISLYIMFGARQSSLALAGRGSQQAAADFTVNQRTSDGGTIVVSRPMKGSSDVLVVIATSRVIRPSVDESHKVDPAAGTVTP